MPSTLRARVAMLGLLGAFLIPIGMTSLRGLTHILTCEAKSETPFSVQVPRDGNPLVTTSSKIEPGDKGLCGGLTLDLAAGSAGQGKLKIIVAITNGTKYPWKGTVSLQVGPTLVPVEIGAIAPKATESDQLTVNLEEGNHELEGSLLIGP